MIQITLDDSIIEILKKISNQKSKSIILDFPFGHPVLHNYVSLKIIQAKCGNKSLSILTNDRTSKKIGKILGITYVKKPTPYTLEKTENVQNKLLKKNYNFFEYGVYEIKKIIGTIKNHINVNKKINSIHYYQNKNNHITRKILFFSIISFITILGILSYIYYFAINKTIIEITPEVNIKIKARNYIYKEMDDEALHQTTVKENIIPLKKISTNLSIKRKINTTGIKQNIDNISKGEVVFFNYLSENIQLKSGTILVNKEGVEFILPQKISIPSAIKRDNTLIPGESAQVIHGNLSLINGEYIGNRTNISSGVLLSIPKLGELKDKIFAKSITKFTGGKHIFQRTLTQNDLENVQDYMQGILKQEAISAIELKIKLLNQKNNTQMIILGVDEIYKFPHIDISIPPHLEVGDKLDIIEITGNISISTYIFNRDYNISKLQTIIRDNITTSSEKLLFIDENSLRFSNIIRRNDLNFINNKYQYNNTSDTNKIEIKATTQIEYHVSKNFKNNTINNNYLQNLKSSILGKNISIAELELINNAQINNVNITVKPFFLKNISQIPNNITIRVLSE